MSGEGVSVIGGNAFDALFAHGPCSGSIRRHCSASGKDLGMSVSLVKQSAGDAGVF